MKILEFFKRYPDEEACKAKFLETRMAKGVVCPVCGSIEYPEIIINVVVDIRWTYRIYELPQDKIARLQQAIDNGNENIINFVTDEIECLGIIGGNN